jgi:hypothetical protein
MHPLSSSSSMHPPVQLSHVTCFFCCCEYPSNVVVLFPGSAAALRTPQVAERIWVGGSGNRNREEPKPVLWQQYVVTYITWEKVCEAKEPMQTMQNAACP